MRRSALDTACTLIKQRQFAKAITLLEGRSDIYEENFDYYITLGTACLYVGDAGTASKYYRRARSIKLTDTRLLLGQAAIYLRRGDTDRALRYYLDIIDSDPGNKIALRAMEFIRTKGDYDTICRWVDSGRIEQFYPEIGVDPFRVMGFIIPVLVFALGAVLVFNLAYKKPAVNGPRANLNAVALTKDEEKNAQERDLSGQVYRYILTDAEISESYKKAMEFFQKENDNAAQIELNKIVNSNAAFSIKQKANVFMGYLKEATFDTIQKTQNNYTYKQVSSDVPLYLDCCISWTGRISNARTMGDAFECDLLVGYETMKRVDGIVPVFFERAPEPPIDGEKPVRILAKVTLKDGFLSLEGRSVYQSVNDSLELR
ncbi:hypothetical protein HRQ91_08545 [Treponema parvum]|uniref:Tetratricopeptide repeat protein n=1 Tax=Treponema parvum TaxID=138851 RepID=A0A975F5S7_9SPIR|nr:hypothetical protein [Treponema parvum]QTQ14499.1 hypothetical protein HRQ91_08545 [Treponema parvum]